ncbi:unnamed protein product [Rhizoctonia solani]|uniref:Uncharacterized protein n=1 Tax=Rhizoctonia solani TaxID=456999 RepID=A0A8H3E8M5_9AGAM|nr:unnamed protein product [Rhizoctonia solani]
MARSRALLNTGVGRSTSAHTSAPSQDTPGSFYWSPSGTIMSPVEAETSRSNGLRAIEQLRKRLDTLDGHTQELRSTRHTLLRREQLLAKERDELVEALNSIEAALMARPLSYRTRILQPFAIHNAPGGRDEGTEESDLPSKRQAISDSADRPTVRKRRSGSDGEASNQGISKAIPLAALGTEPTLIAECPPELIHLLQPSRSLPRPPSSSRLGSFRSIVAPSPRSASTTRNGIRFPPGSAPRHSRVRSASPLTQMLPPPVPSSPATPVRSRKYSVTRDSSPAEFEPPVPYVGAVATCDLSVSTPPKMAIELECPAGPLCRLSRPRNGTVPINLMLNDPHKPCFYCDFARMEPERAPSPPIGTPLSPWAMRPDPHIKCKEEEETTKPETQSAKSTNEKMGYEQNGPASRTRARTNGVGAISKGKGRA